MGCTIHPKGQTVFMNPDKFPFIVFSGMDGTGKTTLSRHLTGFLTDRGITYHYIHGQSYTVSKNSFSMTEDRVKKLKHIFRFGLPLALADNYYTYLNKYRPILRKNILVCDRYFYDKIARLMFYDICNKGMAKLYLSMLPRPDVIFFLDTPAKTAFDRKKEYTEKEYELFRKYYKFVADFLGAQQVNTDQDPEQSVKQVINTLPDSILFR